MKSCWKSNCCNWQWKPKEAPYHYYYIIIISIRKVLHLPKHFIITYWLIPITFGTNEAIYSQTFWAKSLSKVLLSWYLKSGSPAHQFTDMVICRISRIGGTELVIWTKIKQSLTGHAEFSEGILRICFLLNSPCVHESVDMPSVANYKSTATFKCNIFVLHSDCRSKSLCSLGFLRVSATTEIIWFVAKSNSDTIYAQQCGMFLWL